MSTSILLSSSSRVSHLTAKTFLISFSTPTGKWKEAIPKYKQAVEKLSHGVAAAIPVNHPDKGALEQHKMDVTKRISYLQEVLLGKHDTANLVPIDHHIGAVQLTMQVIEQEDYEGPQGNPANAPQTGKWLKYFINFNKNNSFGWFVLILNDPIMFMICSVS